MTAYLFYPMAPSPTNVPKWTSETRPTWLSSATGTASQDSYLGVYGSDGGNNAGLQGTVAVGGGATLDLIYELLTESEVDILYRFWGAMIVREQQRDRSAFRISPVHCLWKLAGCPRTYNLINALWAFSDKALTFEYQGVGDCGKLYKSTISLVSVPEVVTYQ